VRYIREAKRKPLSVKRKQDFEGRNKTVFNYKTKNIQENKKEKTQEAGKANKQAK
jgi:hypothetical protein